MTQAVQSADADLRAYCVHCSDEAPTNTHRVEAKSFTEAAVTFLERWHVEAYAEAVSVIVEAQETGERHCFTVDLSTGEAAPCS